MTNNSLCSECEQLKKYYEIVLERFCYSDDMGVFGKITLTSGMELYTVERPWLDNKEGISCIPTGEYVCKPRRYNRGGYNAIEITDVQGRLYILFHIANTMLNVKGCIGVGTSLGFINNMWAVTDSTDAFQCMMDELGGKEFKLVIRNKFF